MMVGGLSIFNALYTATVEQADAAQNVTDELDYKQI